MVDNDIINKVISEHREKLAKMRKIGPSFRVKKRRSAMDRLKARMRYRRNKNKIKIWRKRYNQRRKLLNSSRKMLRRKSPSWLKKTKNYSSHKPKMKSFFHKMHHGPTTPRPKRPSFHAPKKTNFKIRKPKTIHPYKPKRAS